MTWKLQRTQQCAKCPWRVDVDPHDIPNGYCEQKHKALDKTINEGVGSMFGQQHVMSCHEHTTDEEVYCIGWLVNQVGPGNNIGMRMKLFSCGNANEIEVIGEQNECFEDTLPD